MAVKSSVEGHVCQLKVGSEASDKNSYHVQLAAAFVFVVNRRAITTSWSSSTT